jgi:hypothetical protein
VLVIAALAPFGVSLVPWVYAFLSFFIFLRSPSAASLAYSGVAYSAMFTQFRRFGDRKILPWFAPFAAFAFVMPIFFLLEALGVPLDHLKGYAPP